MAVVKTNACLVACSQFERALAGQRSCVPRLGDLDCSRVRRAGTLSLAVRITLNAYLNFHKENLEIHIKIIS